MIHLLLALPLLSPTPQALTGETAEVGHLHVAPPSATAHRFPMCWAVMYEGNSRLRDSLVRNAEVWHDSGVFLVGAFSREMMDGLADRGIESVCLGASNMAGDLWVISEREIEEEGGKISPLCREMLRVPEGRLLLMPEGVAPLGTNGVVIHASHKGMGMISRRPWKAKLPKYWEGATGPGTQPATNGHDPRVQTLVDQVNPSNLQATVSSLSSLYNRRADRSGGGQARDMIRGWFDSYGYSSQLEWFSSSYHENVYVEIPGTRYPNEWVVAGAHYDSILAGSSNGHAPGADDNASGSAGILEAARILKNAGPFERSIRLMTYGAEELGLIGSHASAQNSRNRGEDVVAMVNTDMNAYRKAGDALDADYIINSTDGPLNAYSKEIGGLYISNWAAVDGILMGGSSDHASYTAEGFPSVFPFEDVSYSPYIHSSNDDMIVSAIDWDLSEMIVKGVLATVVSRAELVDMEITHSPLTDTVTSQGPFLVEGHVASLTGDTVIGMDLFFTGDGGLTWTSSAMDNLGGGDYSAYIPSFGSPVDIQYYLVAHDDQGAAESAPEGVDAGGPAYSFFVGTRNVIYETGFNGTDPMGWTWVGVPLQEGWMRATPGGKSGDATYPYEGNRVWGNDSGVVSLDGAYEPHQDATLSSPAIDCSGAQNVFLEFRRWLTVEDAAHDQAQVLVNGTVVWENATGQDHVDTTWVPFKLDITPLAAGNPSVVVQFRLVADGVVEFGGWNIDAFAMTELFAADGDLVVFGSGVNPDGSMSILSGGPSIGDTVVVGLDNPLGTQSPGALTSLFLSLTADPNYPAGTLVPGTGMAGAGATGELLIGVQPPDPAQILSGPAWSGPGSPAEISIPIPNDPGLVGTYVYGQGLLFDPGAALGVKFGLTEGLLIHVNP